MADVGAKFQGISAQNMAKKYGTVPSTSIKSDPEISIAIAIEIETVSFQKKTQGDFP